jgi:hypothetical protein
LRLLARSFCLAQGLLAGQILSAGGCLALCLLPGGFEPLRRVGLPGGLYANRILAHYLRSLALGFEALRFLLGGFLELRQLLCSLRHLYRFQPLRLLLRRFLCACRSLAVDFLSGCFLGTSHGFLLGLRRAHTVRLRRRRQIGE